MALSRRSSIYIYIYVQEEDIDRVHAADNMWSLPGVQSALVQAVVSTGTPTVLVRTCYLVITLRGE